MRALLLTFFSMAFVCGCGGDSSNQTGDQDGPGSVPPPATDIWTAASHGNVEAILGHLAAGTDINATFVAEGSPGSGGTALHVSILANQPAVFKLLIAKKADLNAKADDKSGGTPLHWTAAFGRAQIAHDLIAAGARINEPDKDGFTPLDTTNYEPNVEKSAKLAIAKMLKEKGGTGRLSEEQ